MAKPEEKRTELPLGKLSKADDTLLNVGQCPFPGCGSLHFYQGPRGGGAVNIFCGNGHRYWYSPPFPSEYQGQHAVSLRGDDLIVKFALDRTIQLKDNPFFAGLASPGALYAGVPLTTELIVCARTGGYDDWAAYFQTPYSGKRVAELGAKMPEKVAAEMFPELAKTGRKYRP